MKPNNFTTNNVKNIHPVPGFELTTYQLGIPKHNDIFLKMCQPRPLLCLCLFLSTSILQKKMLTSGGIERGSSELKTRMLTTSPLPRTYTAIPFISYLNKESIPSKLNLKLAKLRREHYGITYWQDCFEYNFNVFNAPPPF